MAEHKYVSFFINQEFNLVSVSFRNELPKTFAIGEKMYAINKNAYMNGYNWDAFFNYYLSENYPELMEDIEPDPEAGSYVAHYPLSPENKKKAQKFVEIITNLIEHEETIYEIVRHKGDEINWD